jgi:hypothetical protein
MTSKIYGIGILALMSLSFTAQAQVVMQGNVPSLELPGLQAKIDKVWQYESKTYFGNGTLAPPALYFSRFTIEDETPEWEDWLTKDWIQAHLEAIQSFPLTVLAFHYANTNKIQINPNTTFLRFYQNNPYGMKEDTVGYGYYIASHEMMHYVMENRGIPGRLQDCLFISNKPNGTSLMSDMAEYLINEKISGFLIRTVGVQAEKGIAPCEALTADEREQVRQILTTWRQ